MELADERELRERRAAAPHFAWAFWHALMIGAALAVWASSFEAQPLTTLESGLMGALPPLLLGTHNNVLISIPSVLGLVGLALGGHSPLSSITLMLLIMGGITSLFGFLASSRRALTLHFNLTVPSRLRSKSNRS